MGIVYHAVECPLTVLLAYMQMPTLEDELMTEDGRPGWMAYFYRHENDDSMVPLKEPHAEKYVDETRLLLR